VDSTKDFQTRYSDLRDGVGPSGAYVLDKTTVSDDGLADTLAGGDASDWLFVSKLGQDSTDEEKHIDKLTQI